LLPDISYFFLSRKVPAAVLESTRGRSVVICYAALIDLPRSRVADRPLMAQQSAPEIRSPAVGRPLNDVRILQPDRGRVRNGFRHWQDRRIFL
jgi:hypothetical protein